MKKTGVENPWAGIKVLITGVCGTVGRELLRQLLMKGPEEIVGIDNNESALFFLEEQYTGDSRVSLFVGDIRRVETVRQRAEGVDVILHAAALKHVILNERSPEDAIHTNIIGTQNVIESAIQNEVKRVLFTSSDKAVNPTSVMGTSKLMGERLFTAADSLRRGRGPVFISTRFGNVLGSNGSVIPLFKQQISQGGPVRLTDRRMTRFIMTLQEAVRLVTESVFLGHGGEVFVTKMPAIRISDLAEVMIQRLAPVWEFDPADIPIEVIGPKPGEKYFEELINEEEVRRTLELENYYVTLPAFRSTAKPKNFEYEGTREKRISAPYNSASKPLMDMKSLSAYLDESGLLKT